MIPSSSEGALPPTECCDTCNDVLHAYRQKRWVLPRIEQIEQCKNENPEDIERSRYEPARQLPKDDGPGKGKGTYPWEESRFPKFGSKTSVMGT